MRQVAYALRTRAPLSTFPKERLPYDLHVLGLPLAFILSQDQTLHCKVVLASPLRLTVFSGSQDIPELMINHPSRIFVSFCIQHFNELFPPHWTEQSVIKPIFLPVPYKQDCKGNHFFAFDNNLFSKYLNISTIPG
jgi:hypothetical protein